MRSSFVIVFLTIGITFSLQSQTDVTSFGFMLKPIIPSNLFRAGDVSIKSEKTNIQLDLSQDLGYSFGMVIRKGVTKNWTFETGLTYVQRRFSLSIEDEDISYAENTSFGIVGYEVPLMALLNIQLGQQIFMNVAFGGVVDMYPSNIATYGDNFSFLALRASWLQFSLNANVGWEYRTKKKGTIYFGGAYHRPFLPMFQAMVNYVGYDYTDKTFSDISGNYLTADVRYFFHEDPEKRKSRKQRLKEKEEKESIFYQPYKNKEK